MSREELKDFLHRRIDEVDSEELLKKVIFWLDINTGLEEPYELTKAEQQAVQEGLEDYKKGDYVTDEELDKEMDECEEKINSEEPYVMTKAESAAVDAGLMDYRNGNLTSHKDFKLEMGK